MIVRFKLFKMHKDDRSINMNSKIVNIERAINDLKSGMPVILQDNKDKILLIASDNFNNESKNFFLLKESKLVLSKERINFVFKELPKQQSQNSVVVDLNQILIKNLEKIIWQPNLNEALLKILKKNIKATKLEELALILLHNAELIPSCIITKKIPAKIKNVVLTIKSSDLIYYQKHLGEEVKLISQAKIALKNASDSTIYAFRTDGSIKEHLAIFVNSPKKTPLVRIHSSCYTGDLLNSLACDCHDQLHLAIEKMVEAGGGIIIYLLQEGRGIGLINKIRAYDIKNNGLDTVDANLSLGFADDERSFKLAAQILKILNISEISLLSNNPRKKLGLEKCGIKIKQALNHIIKSNKHNKEYLKTKFSKLGHKKG